MSQRTWFFTGTFRDQYHDLEPVGLEVTRYLKRLRYHIGEDHSVRYLIAFERHKSGAWHVHALLHTDRSVVEASVVSSWEAGWAWAKLANVRGAGYLTKYVTKALDEESVRRPRIRASRNPRYGDLVMIHEAELVQRLQERRINVTDTWRTNLRELIKMSEPKKGDALWELAMLMQEKKYREMMEIR